MTPHIKSIVKLSVLPAVKNLTARYVFLLDEEEEQEVFIYTFNTLNVSISEVSKGNGKCILAHAMHV